MSDKNKDSQDQPDQARPDQNETAEDSATSKPQPGTTGDVATRLNALSAEVERLAESLREQRTAFQDAEVSLVSRIGDVDDDRRQAATRLQRTLQAQRDDIDERLKRQSSLIALALLIFLFLVGGALTFVYYQVGEMRQSLAAQVSEIGQAVEHIETPAATPEKDPIAGEQLTKLSAAVADITASLERLSEETEAARAATPERMPPEPLSAAMEAQPVAAEAANTEPAESMPEASNAPAEEASEVAQTPSVHDDDMAVSQRAQTDALAATEEKTPAQPEQSSLEEAKPPTAEETSIDALGSEQQPSPEPNAQAAQEESEAALAAEQTPAEEQIPASEIQSTETSDSAPTSSTRILLGDKPFTLQLMGFYSLDSMEKFISEHELPEELYYQTTNYRGRPWYVLIHSVHDSQEAADAVAGKLPADLAKLDIWIRRLDPDEAVTMINQPAD
ncbi:hypothetical protein G3480_22300 [Thiorhodococcus mannitoliphagus]|uniref:SPOR domain-containing protein n=1 Tax=Thiorhodococcus mannitoliphagus TaxID=329406 RepID=A0A6P1E1Q2_9GAMM|nr:hypothetical protein [Thiorhodococcus mannitoliphagus]NEX22996.1 hypothetical protein [Thiorhodococcus mannitoliphagus]